MEANTPPMTARQKIAVAISNVEVERAKDGSQNASRFALLTDKLAILKIELELLDGSAINQEMVKRVDETEICLAEAKVKLFSFPARSSQALAVRIEVENLDIQLMAARTHCKSIDDLNSSLMLKKQKYMIDELRHWENWNVWGNHIWGLQKDWVERGPEEGLGSHEETEEKQRLQTTITPLLKALADAESLSISLKGQLKSEMERADKLTAEAEQWKPLADIGQIVRTGHMEKMIQGRNRSHQHERIIYDRNRAARYSRIVEDALVIENGQGWRRGTFMEIYGFWPKLMLSIRDSQRAVDIINMKGDMWIYKQEMGTVSLIFQQAFRDAFKDSPLAGHLTHSDCKEVVDSKALQNYLEEDTGAVAAWKTMLDEVAQFAYTYKTEFYFPGRTKRPAPNHDTRPKVGEKRHQPNRI